MVFWGLFFFGVPTGLFIFFSEPDPYIKFMGIVVAVTNLAIAYVFYIIGPGWEVFLEKRKLKAMKREEKREKESKQMRKT